MYKRVHGGYAKGCALKVAFELHLWLHLMMQWLMHKCVQNSSSNGEPDAAIEDTLDGGLNVGFQ